MSYYYMQKIQSGKTILRIRRRNCIKYLSQNGEFQFTDLLDNFLSLPLLIVLNQIVSKSPAIVRRAKEASLAVKGARLLISSQEQYEILTGVTIH